MIASRLAYAGATALYLAASTWPAFAESALEIGEIVVTPNRNPDDKAMVGSKVETITRSQLEDGTLPLVTDYLQLLPGLSIATPGGPGTEGSLSIRGAPRRYVKTIYNGIDISDPTNTQVQTSYQYLLVDTVDRIEVLKGSQSTLYGSDAIAGVISISTLGGIDVGIRHLVGFEGGSFGTARAVYGLRAADDDGQVGINVAGMRTDGISAAAGGRERDGYENVTADINGTSRLSDTVSLFLSGLYIDGRAEFDNDGNPPTDNPFNVNHSKQLAGRAGFELDLMDGRFKNTVSVQGFGIDRSIHSVSAFGPFDGEYQGRRVRFDYQGAYQAAQWLTVQFGLDHERQTARVTNNLGTDSNDGFDLTGLWAQAILAPVADLTVTAGLRHDTHSAFGDHMTYRATASYRFSGTGPRLHASVGTGFRAPSLYELYGPDGGNSALQPESSFSFDIGIEQRLFDDRLVADLTWFMLDIDDLIEFVCTNTWPDPCEGYRQVSGTSRQRGIEASLTYAAAPWLDLGASYTYTRSSGPDGSRTIRVPRHAIGLSATARPWQNWTLSGSARIAVDTVDTGGLRLDDHVLVNAKIAYRPSEGSEVYLRIENLLDQDYQTVRGYASPGLSAFAGFKASF